MIRRLRTLRSPASFSAWLYRIARNRVYQELRRKQRLPDIHDCAPVPDGLEDEDEFSPHDASRIHTCIERLKPEHKEVLVLRFLEEMPYEEIAHVAGCSLGTVKSRIYYAKQALRKEMEAMSDDRR